MSHSRIRRPSRCGDWSRPLVAMRPERRCIGWSEVFFSQARPRLGILDRAVEAGVSIKHRAAHSIILLKNFPDWLFSYYESTKGRGK